MCVEVAARAFDVHTVVLKSDQVRPAGDQVDFDASSVQGGANVRANRTGAKDCDFHVIPHSVWRPK
ncbi:hypothetical protein GCM10009765_38160 [Fodinicola feengrottensis]|uniref:Uncharacterized protein n=1 Tax=Fodinicola feengrottensis TaxID=435914 RepID=A0ABN2HCK5_9ACTN